MKSRVVSVRLETGVQLDIHTDIPVGIYKPENAWKVATAKFLRMELEKFIHYCRVRLLKIEADSSLYRELAVLELKLNATSRTNLFKVCEMYVRLRNDIETLLPGERSAHYKTWTLKFNNYLSWAAEYTKLFPYENKPIH